MCEEKEKQVCEAEKKVTACRFIRIGGGYQPVISGSRDFEALLNLDDAHWEVTSLSVTSLRADKRFLDFLDTDKNGAVRTDEVRNALRFLLDVFRDLSDVDNAESVIDLNKINTDNVIGQEIYSAARTMLSAIGKDGENSKDHIQDLKHRIGGNCGGAGGPAGRCPAVWLYTLHCSFRLHGAKLPCWVADLREARGSAGASGERSGHLSGEQHHGGHPPHH